MKIIFSDLDGSLLDHHTYSFEAALTALAEVKERDVPLILCSSKTRAEMVKLQEKLGISDPFIAENGGALYFRKDSSGFRFDYDREDEDFRVIELGVPRPQLRAAFVEVNAEMKLNMRSFSDMTADEVSDLTSLPLDEARLAMEREYTEPFIIPEMELIRKEEIIAEFEKRGLMVQQGGRFFHLMGRSDKGDAVRRVRDIYSSHFGEVVDSIGLGDSENDLPMLKAVKRPVVIRRHDGSCFESADTEGFGKTEGTGPSGWNEAVLSFLEN